MLIAICFALMAGSSAVDTARVTGASGPTIEAEGVGIRSLARIAVVSDRARAGGSQLKAGVIGAGIVAAVAVVIVKGFNEHDESRSQSLVLTGAVGAAAGFIIGVLVAGPDSKP